MRRPASSPLSLSIVLPCYDEAANVERVVRACVRVGREVARDLEVLVVDDGSTDETAAIVRGLSGEIPELRLLRHPTNRGYGAALRTGFRGARHTWVFYTDGDGQLDVEALPRVLPLLERHDIVSAYRAQRQDGTVRSIGGVAWTALVNACLDVRVRDVNCAFKIYPRAFLLDTPMRSEGALIDAEMLSDARRRGLRIAQVAVRHFPREAGRQTGAAPRVIARAFVELAGLVVDRAADFVVGDARRSDRTRRSLEATGERA